MQNSAFFFLLVFLTNIQNLHVASAHDYLYTCGSTGNDTENNSYQADLAKLFTSLSTETVALEGFATYSIVVPDQIFGLVLCRGDVNSSVCGSCLNKSMSDIQTLCPNSKEATIWYDFCLLRYSNDDFLSSTDNSHQVIMWNSENVTSERFNGWSPLNVVMKSYYKTMMNTLLQDVAQRAAYESSKRFGVGDINITSSVPIIYSMAQCTPDMPNHACHACLQDLINEILNNFDGRKGGRILGVRCSLRYEIYNFLYKYQAVLPLSSISGPPKPIKPHAVTANRPAPAPLPTQRPHSLSTHMPSLTPRAPIDNLTTPSPSLATVPLTTNKGRTMKLLIIIINVIAVLLLFGSFIGFCWLKKKRYSGIAISRKERRPRDDGDEPNIWSGERSSDFTFFDFNQIVKATDNFSLGQRLGQGGFGTVYKGVLKDGLEVAVKRLSAQSCQGMVEFKNEIQLIAKLQHTNLVRLVGWCIDGEEKLLVYEFMPNKSLDTFIFDKKRGVQLNWEKRFEIIEGIAQGLLYLHKHSRLRVIHRDLKASNILLDSEMIPKISDFGLARIFGPKELQANTSRVVGTYGYMAPEYASEGLFSIKSDVYSFGVLVLEIISGKRNMGFHQYGDFLNLLGYAWDRWKEGQISELISSTLTEAPEKQIERCIQVALLCVQENPIDRPIIADAINYLSSENVTLPEPKPPAYFNIRVAENEFESSYFYGSSRSVNYMTMTCPEGR
ncbi:cysteine-rich RECEPTOR-like kinase [Rhynchospora pubera]|uniref:non-specific serine/threonine protein kinase n=1 Tax=Rhynchospora pubera TaxID=906938 RepID=A0AAV8G6L3_9POAL|nr:cysteine-rich RECEPTOR-like kinase [Rhynchospora pubera]